MESDETATEKSSFVYTGTTLRLMEQLALTIN